MIRLRSLLRLAVMLPAVLVPALMLAGCDAPAQDLRKAMTQIGQGQSRAGFLQLQNLAAAGYPPAQFRLGMLYLQGQVSPERLAKAERWLALAAGNGDVGARYFQALLWLSPIQRGGQGAAQSAAQGDAPGNAQAGLAQLEQLAAEGFVPAHLRLARMHEAGPEPLRNQARALGWYRKAAERGNRAAIQRLVEAYRQGELGLATDPEQARQWQRRLTVDPFGRRGAGSSP
ncbi:sel1 repeat family protein [Thiohalocapsa marina]|uniref:Sel1 repeat family protein n=1 Tax=Thiohalocapsa marina TaxID=424902 RepID=A0A5M8FVE1_9GAMM|nr:SEL1-like repeat protein [Thiohalocapsa marina]KAA6187801.1 sel1 repeat family protein [Thiohalocapsa marina]